jgi:hypothetical protein
MPRLTRTVLVATSALAALATAALAAAPVATGLAGALAELRVACASAPAAVCADRAAALFDGNRDGGVSRDELAAAQQRLRGEAQAKESVLNDQERLLVAVALAALDRAGPETVFAGFDANGDGRLDRAELFADFRLDKRPFATLVGDPKAVDWQRFAGRFGETGKLFLALLPAAASAR